MVLLRFNLEPARSPISPLYQFVLLAVLEVSTAQSVSIPMPDSGPGFQGVLKLTQDFQQPGHLVEELSPFEITI